MQVNQVNNLQGYLGPFIIKIEIAGYAVGLLGKATSSV